MLYWQFFYVWLFMNCSESALHIKSSRKCPIQPKRNKKWVMERMKWKYRTGSNHRKESRSTFTKSAFDQECKKGNYSFYFCISIRWKWKIDFRSTAWCGRQRHTYSSVSRWNEELDWYERVSRQVLEDGTYRDPYHVEPIELTKKRQRKIFLVQHLLGWARYLFW